MRYSGRPAANLVAGMLLVAAGGAVPLSGQDAAVPHVESALGPVSRPKLVQHRSNYLPLGEMMAQGHVRILLEAFIGVDGSVHDVRVLACRPGTPRIALAAAGQVRRWRYEPALRNGVPVEVYGTVRQEYHMNNSGGYVESAAERAWENAMTRGMLAFHDGEVELAATQFALARDAAAAFEALDVRHPRALEAIAMVKAAQGERGAVIELLKQAVDERGRAFGEDHPDLGADLLNLATSEIALNQRASAKERLQRAVKAVRGMDPVAYPEVLPILNLMATVQVQGGEMAAAERTLRRSLALTEQVHGAASLPVAKVCQSLGRLYAVARRLEKAEPLLARSIQIRERIGGSEAEAMVAALDEHAQILSALGRHSEAQAALERAAAWRAAGAPGS